jgi:hypothetical protein
MATAQKIAGDVKDLALAAMSRILESRSTRLSCAAQESISPSIRLG